MLASWCALEKFEPTYDPGQGIKPEPTAVWYTSPLHFRKAI